MVKFKKNNPGCGCCDTGCYACAADEVEVVVTGLANDPQLQTDCCGDENGTWILPFLDGTHSGTDSTCRWRALSPVIASGSQCDGKQILVTVNLNQSAIGYTLSVRLLLSGPTCFVGGQIVFTVSDLGDIPCDSTVHTLAPFFTSLCRFSPKCDDSAASATVELL